MTTNTTPTSDPAETAAGLTPAMRGVLMTATVGNDWTLVGNARTISALVNRRICTPPVPGQQLARLTNFGRQVHDLVLNRAGERADQAAAIARHLTYAQRNALTARLYLTGEMSTHPATARVLEFLGLAVRVESNWIKLTDLGRAVRLAIQGDQPEPMRQQPEQQHQAADQPGAVDETGECVHCGQTVRVGAFTVLGDRTVTEDHDEPTDYPDDRPRPCIGSLVPPRTSDGDLYLFRRDALANAEAARDRAEQVWREVAADVAACLRPAVAVAGPSAATIVRLTALFDQWVWTAVVGNWPEAIAQALHDLTAERRDTANPFTAARDEVRRTAVREWLDDIAYDVKAAHPEFMKVLGIR